MAYHLHSERKPERALGGRNKERAPAPPALAAFLAAGAGGETA